MIYLTQGDFSGTYRLNFNLENNVHNDAIRTIEESILKDIFNTNFYNLFVSPASALSTNSFTQNLNSTIHCHIAYKDFMVPLTLLYYVAAVAPSGRPVAKEFEKVFYLQASLINVFLKSLERSQQLHQNLQVDASGVGRHFINKINYDNSSLLPWPIPEGAIFTDGTNDYVIQNVIYTADELQYTFNITPPADSVLTNKSYRAIIRKNRYIIF